MAVGRYTLETTGRPELEPLERSAQRLFDQLHNDARAGESATTAASAFSADGAVWASPAPTTTQEAITRLAAAVSGILGTPIP
jgi:selenocysteine lyase/cysteine desulfurase